MDIMYVQSHSPEPLINNCFMEYPWHLLVVRKGGALVMTIDRVFTHGDCSDLENRLLLLIRAEKHCWTWIWAIRCHSGLVYISLDHYGCICRNRQINGYTSGNFSLSPGDVFEQFVLTPPFMKIRITRSEFPGWMRPDNNGLRHSSA